jgi:hypothetical protein
MSGSNGCTLQRGFAWAGHCDVQKRRQRRMSDAESKLIIDTPQGKYHNVM